MVRSRPSRAYLAGLFTLILLHAPVARAQTPPPQPTPAVLALLDPARKALRERDFSGAEPLFRKALEKARELQDRKGEADGLLGLGAVHTDSGRSETGMAFFQQALPLFQALGDIRAEGRTLGNMAVNHYKAGRMQKALEFYELALPKFRAVGAKADEAMSLSQAGTIYLNLGQMPRALTLFQQALPLHQELGNRPMVAGTLLSLGIAYHRTGQDPQAVEHFEKALEISRSLGDRKSESSALHNLGLSYNQMGQKSRATQALEQALPVHREVGDRQFEANALNTLGPLYQFVGQPARAIDAFEKAIPLFRAVGDRYGEAAALSNASNVYKYTGDLAKALAYCEKALPVFRAIGDRESEAKNLGNAGTLAMDLGRPQRALDLYEQARTVFQATGDRASEAPLLSLIGNVYLRTGQPEKARDLYQQALTFYKTNANLPGESQTLGSMGILMYLTGQPQKALEFYQQKLQICRDTGDRTGEAGTLGNIGIAYSDLGQDQKARDFFEQELSLTRAIGFKPGEASALGNLGILYDNFGQRRKAADLFQQALALHRAMHDPGAEATVLNSLGRLYADTDPTQAAALYRQALALHRSVGNPRGEADAISGLARLAAKAGRLREARERCRQSLALRRAAGDTPKVATGLADLAAVETQMKRSDDARAHYAEAVALLETLRERLGGLSEAKTTYLASTLRIYYAYLNLLLERGETEKAFEIAQKTKARSLLDLMASGRVSIAGLTPDERRQEQALRQKADLLNAQMVKEGVQNEVGAKARYADLKTRLRQTEGELQALTDTLYARHPELVQKRVARTATRADVARFLPADTALLDYIVLAKDRLALFVVTRSQARAAVQALTLRIDYPSLTRTVAAFRAACADPRQDYRKPADDLYAALLAPAAGRLAGAKRLVVCPDGALWDVPFQALRDRGRFVAQRYEVVYAYSATGAQAALATRAGRKKPTGSLLALANPDFGSSKRFGDLDAIPGQRPIDSPSRPIDSPSRPLDSPSRPLDSPSRAFDSVSRAGAIVPLPGTQREADALKREFPTATILTGKVAQESDAKRKAGGFRYLHFATHGFFNDASPLLSSIVLAQPTDTEDGFLTAREIFGMDLSAEMTVLSACNTARGRVRTGDGVIGLTWALFAAGCPTQVVSQWAVDDASTATLMERFYKTLPQGKGAALRRASLSLMADPKRRHPYYWAPFVLIGDWR